MRTAHEAAYNQGILHRDISAGNVLIIVRESVVDGELQQERDGMLTDWELSKRTDAPSIARQPDRMVSHGNLMPTSSVCD